MNNPWQNMQAGVHAGTTSNTKPTPYGIYNGGGGGDGGPMARITQFPALQAQNPLSYANGNKQRWDETIPTSEPLVNTPHPVKRKVRPLLRDNGYPKVTKGEFVFIKQKSALVNDYMTRLAQSGQGDEPVTLISLAQFNDVILRKQIEMVSKGKRDEFDRLAPIDFLADWRLDGIVQEDGGATTWGGQNSMAESPNKYYYVGVITKGQVECKSFWGGKLKSGDRLYIILKKDEWVSEYTLKNRFNGSNGISLKEYGGNSLKLRPYQFGFYAITDGTGQLPMDATTYENEYGEKRYDGLAIFLGTVLHEPRLNPRNSNSFHPDNNFHPHTNANQGLSDSIVTDLVIIYNSDGGANAI